VASAWEGGGKIQSAITSYRKEKLRQSIRLTQRKVNGNSLKGPAEGKRGPRARKKKRGISKKKQLRQRNTPATKGKSGENGTT